MMRRHRLASLFASGILAVGMSDVVGRAAGMESAGSREGQARGNGLVPIVGIPERFGVTPAVRELGDLRLFPTGQPLPLASSINFRAGQTRANNTIMPLGTAGQITVQCDMAPGSTGTTHFLMDVMGYFK